MPIVYKFAKNCRVGDFVIPARGEPMLHSYWKITEITSDLVRYKAGPSPYSLSAVGDLNDVVLVRPDAPRFINRELLDEYYGFGGKYSPWPWDWKNKSSSELKEEVGEDMSCTVFMKWHMDAINRKQELAKMERPELMIRTMHDRAVQKFHEKSNNPAPMMASVIYENKERVLRIITEHHSINEVL